MRNATAITYIAYIYATGITITENRKAGVCGPIRSLDRPEGSFTAADLEWIFQGEGFEIDGAVTFEADHGGGFRMQANLIKIDRPTAAPYQRVTPPLLGL